MSDTLKSARQPNHRQVAMQSFDPFLAVLREIPDPRRAEGMLYKLPYVLLFSILAVVTGGNSFRSIETFIRVHRHRLNTAFGLHWRRARARPHRHPLHPSGPQSTGRRAGVPPPRRRSAERCYRSVAAHHITGWKNAAGEASTVSPTAKRPNCCTHSTPKPAWFWRTSISTKNPTRSPPRSGCLANSRSHKASSPWMPCTAKKNLRSEEHT